MVRVGVRVMVGVRVRVRTNDQVCWIGSRPETLRLLPHLAFEVLPLKTDNALG